MSDPRRAAVARAWSVKDRSTFDALRSTPFRVREGVLSLRWVPEPGGAGLPTRLAFAIPRNVGTAVARNRLRRQLRELLRRRPLPDGAVLVTVAAGARGLPAGALADAVAGATEKLGALARDHDRPVPGRTAS